MLAFTDRWRHVAHRRLKLRLQRGEHASRPRDRGEAKSLSKARGGCGPAQAPRVGYELAESGAARRPLEGEAALILDIRTSRFDDAAIRHAGRTHAFAGAAAETEVDVLHLLLVERQRPALPLRHEVDPAARRLGLEPGDTKRGAGVEAEAAVDARGQVVVGQACKRRGALLNQTTNLPGFKTPSGSKAFLIRRMMPIVAGAVPQAPTSRMKSSGPASMTRVPPTASAFDRSSLTLAASLAIAQCATPMPGAAHQPAPLGSASTSRRSSDRGAAMLAHRTGARLECRSQIDCSSTVQPSSPTTRSTAS